ncbi:hypothetical protein LTR12_014394 [Friedmanniomyces endolithicus]|nr:hypothetical protein LTR74_006703 [Friedmanniomyces endolithicus]KAK1811241.1 hypothetical protein LTR12_014394 [Friedmanniomyces endolithicus]
MISGKLTSLVSPSVRPGNTAQSAEYKSTPDSRYDGMRTRTSRDIMLDIAGLPQLSKECETRVPPPGAKIEDFLSRWSNTKVSLPAAVILPANEDDIRAVVKYAACQGLRVLPVAGAHGTFVPIDDRCVYLDLSRFNTIELDEDAGAATFGGGGTKGMLEHDFEGKKFFPAVLRGRNVFVQAVPWWTDEAVEEQARAWAAETLALANAPQHEQNGGGGVTAYASNLSKNMDLSTVWPAYQIEEIQRLKTLWDAKGVFWNPVVDGV